MKRIRYLTLLLVLLGCMTAWAQDDFDPMSPAEPGGPISPKSALTLVDYPNGAANQLSGGGSYVKDEQVTVSAIANSGFKFVNWTDKDGFIVSTTSAFTYTKKEHKETLTANFEFDPTAPEEPNDINQNVKYWLRIVAEEGAGSVTSSARYKAGTSVTVSATAQSLYSFVGWYDSEGHLLADGNSTFTLTMPAEEMNLTAKFDYTPENPDEPGQINAKYVLTLAAEEGGSVSADSYRLEEGQRTRVTATPSLGFDFVGWYHNGLLYTESPEFTYEMGAANAVFEAHFLFNPGSPSEPAQIKEKDYAFYLMNIMGRPGDVVRFPVYLTTRQAAKDMTFQLSFPDNLAPDMTTYTVSESLAGYTVNYANGESSEGHKVYVFTLTAGDAFLAIGDNALLTFNITIPEDIETAKGYPVTINQVSVSDTEGTSQSAGTRNGRVSVYKNGDVNGNDFVDIGDAVCIVNHLVGKPSEMFVEVAANPNNNNCIDIGDAVTIVNLIVGKIDSLPRTMETRADRSEPLREREPQ